MPLFGPTQLLGPRERQALIESGAYTAEDFGGKTVPPPAPQGPNYKSGSSAAADQRAITGETPLQQRQRQDAQLKALLESRKRKGYAGGGAVLGGLGRLAKHLSGDAPARRGVTDVIKERGGQWLSGAYSPEAALKPLRKMPFGEEPEQRLRDLAKWEAQDNNPETLRAIGIDRATQTRNAALNAFVDKQLAKYVRRDLATEGDPVRKLAEQGILHLKPQELYDAEVEDLAEMSRSKARKRGFPGAGPRGVSEEAAAWDSAADASLHVNKAGTLAKDANAVDIDSWLPKVDQETPVYEPSADPRQGYSLGFEHLMDELGNAINPESGLPPQLQITPEQIKSGNFSMEAAVRRVAEINAWREAQKVEASKALANNAATHLHKDYPDKGFKWVELKAPEASLGEYPTPEAFYKANGKTYDQDTLAALKDALKYEGDTMGHCVGGYCQDVAEGRSRIYSLRDSKGQPHVTIEVAPEPKPHVQDLLAEDRIPKDLLEALIKDHGPGGIGWSAKLRKDPRMMEFLSTIEQPQRIVQIKGKGNAKPKDDYIPFVQDFVKSGQWSEVGDFQNTGLVKMNGQYMTPDEALQERVRLGLEPSTDNFASGGLININPKKPLALTVTPDDVLYGNEVDENNAARADQAYNESRERMMAARRREDAIANSRPVVIDEIMAELPSSLYVPPPELSASSAAPAYSSMEDAVKTMGDWRLGIGQAIASPLLVTDAAEAGLDALRGVKSPSRFRQVSNAISKAFGGPEESANRLEGPHDMQALAASLVNPGNLVSMAKLPKAMMATRGITRLLKGHSAEAITAPAAQLRQIKDYDDFHKQVSDLSRVQDLRGRHLLGKGASIPDLTTDYLYNWENGGKVYEVLPGPRNKRGWASIAPTEAGKPAYISGIMAEEPGSKDFVNGTFNALLNEIKGPAHATAANGALARYYKSKGIKVGDDWSMNFAKGGKVAPLPAKMRPCDCKPKAMAAGGSVDEEILKLHGY